MAKAKNKKKVSFTVPVDEKKEQKRQRDKRINEVVNKNPAEVTLEDVFNLLVDTNERLDELEKKLKL